MRSRAFHAWLVVLSDPRGVRGLPSCPLPARCWADLYDLADRHGVLPAMTANTKWALETHGLDRIVTGADAGSVLERALGDAKRRLVTRTALTLAIRAQTREIAAAFGAAAVRAAVLKGADFADHLYPDPSLRPFTDLDLLVPQEQIGAAERVLTDLGYAPCRAEMKYASDYGQRSWRRPDRREGTVEVHCNLVNSPKLRRGLALAWGDLAFADDSESREGLLPPTASARLLIAAVHAAASHGFDRLQLLYDVSLAAAVRPFDIEWMTGAVRRTGATLALAVSLSLAARLLGAPACCELQRQMRLPRGGLWTILLDRGVVLRGHAPCDSFRRQLFREMLKRR